MKDEFDPDPRTSYAEYMDVSVENIAAILALIGKEEQTTKSPTAILMLSKLKENMKVLFDKMHRGDIQFAMLRIGIPTSLDKHFYEYGSVRKQEGVTKLRAQASFLNTVAQNNLQKEIKFISGDETSDAYEFIAYVREY